MLPTARSRPRTGRAVGLAEAEARRGSGDASSEGWPVTALPFLEARDLNEATQIAEAHPAVRYGSAVEVRPWAPPLPTGTGTASPEGTN